MVRVFAVVVLAAGLLAVPDGGKPVTGQEATKGKASSLERMTQLLQSERVKDSKDLRTTPLSGVLADLAAKHNVTFTISRDAFADKGEAVKNAKAPRVNVKKLAGQPLGEFLDGYLRALNVSDVTYIARPDSIEITTTAARLSEKAARVFPVADLVIEKPPQVLTAAEIVAVLHDSRVSFEQDLHSTPFPEVLADISKKHKVIIVLNPTAFENTTALNDAKAERLTATKLDGISIKSFLDIYLRALSVPDVTYIVRPTHIEITTRQAALKEAGLMDAVESAVKAGEPGEIERAKMQLTLPLVCIVTEGAPLRTILADLTRVYGVNLVIDSEAARAMKDAKVTAHLLNVPADTALELLAGQGGLTVTRRGTAFRLSSPGAQ